MEFCRTIMKLFGRLNRDLALLILILLLAAVLRLWGLGKYPVGFTPDEASFGYDAYSLLTTGKDQWGAAWPISFRSFGDFKLPVYTYLAIPSVAIFGLNQFAVRLPNAIIGIVAVLALYLMLKQMFRRDDLALFSALLLAISPWHIALSRGAFEANLTVFFMAIGVWLFYKGLEGRKWLVLSALSFGINLFTYHSARLVTPLLLLILIIWNRRELGLEDIKNIWNVFISNWLTVVVFLIFLVAALATVFMGSGARAADITIFNPTDKWMSVFDTRYGAVFEGMPYTLAVFFSNKVFGVISQFISSYATYISPQFLFTEGAGEWTYGMIAGWGVLYLVEIPFVLASLYFIAKRGWNGSRPLSLIFFWILISIIPAALTKGPGYAGNRAAVMIPAVQVFLAFGGLLLYEVLSKRFVRIYINSIYIFGLALSLIFFLEAYRYVAPRNGAEGMLFGRSEAISYVSTNAYKYKEIIISRSLSEPQIFVAFYLKYDPSLYQKDSQKWLAYKDIGVPFVDQLGEYSLGKFVFKDINYNEDSKLPNVLLLGKPTEFPQGISPTKEILYPNQNPAIFIIDPAKVVSSK